MKAIALHIIFVLVLILSAHGIITAQPAPPAETDSIQMPEWHFSLVTCGPGREIYQLEGHTALRAQSNDGRDLAINWGVFDFEAPGFIYRFVKGETDYMADCENFSLFLRGYLREGRSVTEQGLNLTPEQNAALVNLIDKNLLPANRVYRYNYVKDNCATRPLALIERAAGSDISFTPSSDDHTSWRQAMTAYHRNYPWYQFGIDLALGSGIDRPVSTRELTFAPVYLCDRLATATMTDTDGKTIPVVKSTRVLDRGKGTDATCGPTPWPLTPTAVGCYLLIAALWLTMHDLRRGRLTRWFDSALFGIQTLMGLLLTFLIFVSVHEATSPNWVYLWLNPFCAIAAIGVWIKKGKRVVYWYQICNFAALIALLACHWLHVQQLNAAAPLFIAAALTRSFTEIYLLRPRAQTDNKINK